MPELNCSACGGKLPQGKLVAVPYADIERYVESVGRLQSMKERLAELEAQVASGAPPKPKDFSWNDTIKLSPVTLDEQARQATAFILEASERIVAAGGTPHVGYEPTNGGSVLRIMVSDAACRAPAPGTWEATKALRPEPSPDDEPPADWREHGIAPPLFRPEPDQNLHRIDPKDPSALLSRIATAQPPPPPSYGAAKR